MIAALTGRVIFKSPAQITVDVHGVGYEILIPLSTYYSLPEIDESTSLRVYTHLREDAIQLFGFLTMAEQEAFILLTGISGIGPKLALSVLSTLPIPDLSSAIQAGDLDKLATVPGIGKKSAARIALELKDKIERLGESHAPVIGQGAEGGLQDDALSALVNLGYRAADAKDVLARIARASPNAVPLKDLIREALKELARA
ncbi:MAG TPA: Holliday junction branch migration protein RuvA [Nitrospiraceae bacterium]|nr:Holliday junction branch migration protein RuvA [Nitrospiraceae bacterium]